MVYNHMLQILVDGGPMFVREREHEVAHRQMLCRVLESLRYNGWEVMIAARLSRRVNKSQLVVYQLI